MGVDRSYLSEIAEQMAESEESHAENGHAHDSEEGETWYQQYCRERDEREAAGMASPPADQQETTSVEISPHCKDVARHTWEKIMERRKKRR